MPKPASSRWKPYLAAALATTTLVLALTLWLPDSGNGPEETTLDAILTDAREGTFDKVVLNDADNSITGYRDDQAIARANYNLGATRHLTATLDEAGVTFTGKPPASNTVSNILLSFGPVLLIILVIAILLLSRYSGNSGLSSFLTTKVTEADVPDTRLSDVAGIDEVVEELRELVTYLAAPQRWQQLGATPPAGVLLAGPPGTGKTLLAKAVAGEAGVPFYPLSGSQFVEMFVGVGARRIRDVFAAAGNAERSIIFIDELDAIGKTRASGPNIGATEERENALNELLVQLDGFSARTGVLVIAATNRPDVLDPALTRPKRFDRQITVPPPDRDGRLRILTLHAAGKQVADTTDFDKLTRRTAGFTGAQLENLINEAARQAARENATEITDDHLDSALATLALGRERRTAAILEHDRHITAVHEAGHTLAALTCPDIDDPVHVSIVPRGPSGGQTWLQQPDGTYLTKPAAEQRLIVTLAGRAAEEHVFAGHYTQGAAHDLKAATELATSMVAEWGMSPLGPIYIPEDARQIGPAAEQLQTTINTMLATALEDARTLLGHHTDTFDQLVTLLLERETLTGTELRTQLPLDREG